MTREEYIAAVTAVFAEYAGEEGREFICEHFASLKRRSELNPEPPNGYPAGCNDDGALR